MQSEATRVLESIKSAEWIYKAIGESIDFGVWVCDAQGANIYASKSFLELVGITQEQCSGSGWADVLHPDDVDRTIAAWQECVRTGGKWDIEHRFKGADGRYHAVLARGMPVRGPDGSVVCWAGINLDIGEIKRAEDRLRESERRKDEFLATLAHELRNPLAPIRSAAHAIRVKAAGDPQIQRMQEIIDRQIEHLSRLVDDLLDVSRITHDKIEVRKEHVLLRDCVEYAIEVTRPHLEARRHAFHFEPVSEPLWVIGDAARISQSIANLLSNAIKFTEPSGWVKVRMCREGDHATVSVADNGIGMPEALQAHVFDLFVQGDRSLERSQGGLGLGLSLVKRLVELHDGTVSASSAGAGRGSEFKIRLPLAPAATATTRTEPQDPRRAAPRRVLVVDDNRDAAETTADILRHAHHEVKTAYSGPAALGVARVFRPDAVFLDIGLPGMDGYEIARRLKEFPETSTARLIALTGYGLAEDVARSQAAGFDEHLVKPVDPLTLARVAAGEAPVAAKRRD